MNQIRNLCKMLVENQVREENSNEMQLQMKGLC